MELNVNKVYGSIYEEAITDIRRKQHDFQNQLTAIYSSHRVAGTLDELVEMQKNYCDVLQEDNEYEFILMACGEPVLAGFLYYKCLRFKEQGVRADCEIHILSWDCEMMLYELIEVLGIFLDNAVEKELENDFPEKLIELKILDKEAETVIQVSNWVPAGISLQPDQWFQTGYSSKGEGRGLGLSRARQICRSYGLEIEVVVEQTERQKITFSVSVPHR